MRAQPAHKSEMVSQLLFGETYKITDSSKDWLQILTSFDGYSGWIDKNQHHKITEAEYKQFDFDKCGVSLEMVSPVTSPTTSIPIVCGSNLPGYDGINFKIQKEKYIYNGQAFQHDQARPFDLLEKIAYRFLNAPYLWGGRSPLGIDCSGFVQIVFKTLDIKLKRDAYLQAEYGQVVNFVQEAKAGDLAFFHNTEGKIIHVGIVLKEQQIIHASGKVRIDTLDHFGIFNAEMNKYSHHLKIIKRLN